MDEQKPSADGLFLVGGPKDGAARVVERKPQTTSLVIPGESQEEFEALENGLLQKFQPVGATETVIVKDLARFQWLKERAIRFEALAAPGAPGLETLRDYRVTNERGFTNALRVLLGLQKQRQTAEILRPQLVAKRTEKAPDKS